MTLDSSRPLSSSQGTPLDVPSPSPAATLSRVTTAEGSPLPIPAKRKRRRLPKLPKDSKVYKTALSVIALRAQGVKSSDIAQQLGYAEQTIHTYLKRAHRKGWIDLHSFDDPDDQLEYVLKHKIVRNLDAALDEKEIDKDGVATERMTHRAFEVALEGAKGTGLFKQHQVVKGDTQTNVGVALRVQVEMPPLPTSGNTSLVVRPGTVGGAPALDIPVEAELVTPNPE